MKHTTLILISLVSSALLYAPPKQSPQTLPITEEQREAWIQKIARGLIHVHSPEYVKKNRDKFKKPNQE